MSLQTMAPVLNKKPYQKGAYFPLNTQYLLGFNEPNKACALRPRSARRTASRARGARWAVLTALAPARRSQANLTSMQAAQLWPQVVAVRAPTRRPPRRRVWRCPTSRARTRPGAFSCAGWRRSESHSKSRTSS